MLFGASLWLAVPQFAYARLAEPTLVLGRMAAWGAVAGAGTGVLMWPLTGQVRTVAVGASVGLYLGLVYGAYLAFDPDRRLQSEELQGASVSLAFEAQNQRAALAHGQTAPWVNWTIRF